MPTRRIIIEAAGFLAVVSAVGFAVNAGRSDGLRLSRNYFRAEPPRPPRAVDDPFVAEDPPPDQRDHEFQTLSLEEVHEYYTLGDTSIVFVDARNDDAYAHCHIPGSVQFFHYYPERYIDGLLAVTDYATVIIVYCNGGNCEDSIQAAQYLIFDLDPSLPYEKVHVFEGGIQEWAAEGYPLEPENCKP